MALQRGAVFTPRDECAPPWGRPLPLILHPTQVGIGTSPQRFFVGAVVMNPICLLIVTVFFFAVSHLIPDGWLVRHGETADEAKGLNDGSTMTVTALLRGRSDSRTGPPPSREADAAAEPRGALACVRELLPSPQRAATTRMTNMMMCGSLLLIQATLYAALLLLCAPDTPAGLRVLGLFVLLACGLAIARVVHGARAVPATSTFVSVRESTRALTVAHRTPLVRAARWLFYEGGDWYNVTHGFFVELYGPLYWDYWPAGWWWMGAEVGFSALLAFSEMLSQATGSCLAGGIVGLIVVIGYTAAVLWHRPLSCRLDLALAVVLAVALFVAAVCNITYHLTGKGEAAREGAAFAGMIIELTALVMMVFHGCRGLQRVREFVERRGRRDAISAAEEDKLFNEMEEMFGAADRDIADTVVAHPAADPVAAPAALPAADAFAALNDDVNDDDDDDGAFAALDDDDNYDGLRGRARIATTTASLSFSLAASDGELDALL
jgi:hypothetical protein